MTPNEERWHYTALKKLLALLRRIMPRHNGDECCLNRLYLFRIKGNLESHVKLCKNKIFL